MTAPQTEVARQNETVKFTVTVLDTAGAAVNISGATLQANLARRFGAASTHSTADSPATITAAITDAANGVLQITIPDTVTASMGGDYCFEVWVDDASGNQVAVARGYLTVRLSTR